MSACDGLRYKSAIAYATRTCDSYGRTNGRTNERRGCVYLNPPVSQRAREAEKRNGR